MKKVALIVALVLSINIYAQDDASNPIDFLNLSLEELMNVKIVSASRSEEDAFDSPLSSFVLTKEEIELSGANSIPEALRLVPGLIVRELANGTYDVSLRGGIDNAISYNYTYTNLSILAMIDNRPVFSNLQGGTYWQNLPIGLTEIERIEIVLGPSSALYGPNAVSGVINIISKKPEATQESNFSALAVGGHNTNMININGGARLNDKFYLDAGLNYEYRTRYDNKFYDGATETYVALDSFSSSSITDNIESRFPNAHRSLYKFGGNVNLHYQPSEDINLVLNGGVNQNFGLYSLAASTALSNFTNISQNIGIGGNIKKFTVNASYLAGVQGLTGNNAENNYNYNNTDLYVDYNQKLLSDKLTLRPALSFQSAYANDKEYTVDKGLSGTFNGEGRINNIAASLKADYRPIEKLRIILAGRYDQFNYPNKGVMSYQAILNYKLNDNHILRAINSKSYNGSFLLPTLITTINEIGPGMQISLNGNENLDLANNTLFELGYRTKIKENTILDIALFHQHFQGFSTLIAKIPEFDPSTSTMTFGYNYENLPLEVKQNGITIALQSSFFNNKLQIRPNITLQESKFENYSEYYNDQGAFGNTLDGHRDSTRNIDSEGTADWFGGLNIIYNPIPKLFIDISSYYFGDHVLHSAKESSFTTGAVEKQVGSDIKSKVLINLNVTYNLSDNLNVFINSRNLTNLKSAEGFGSDVTGVSVMGGLRFNY